MQFSACPIQLYELHPIYLLTTHPYNPSFLNVFYPKAKIHIHHHYLSIPHPSSPWISLKNGAYIQKGGRYTLPGFYTCFLHMHPIIGCILHITNILCLLLLTASHIISHILKSLGSTPTSRCANRALGYLVFFSFT